MLSMTLFLLITLLALGSVASGQGLSGEECQTNNVTCQGNRVCYEFPEPISPQMPDECSANSTTCVCLSSDPCEDSDDCEQGERCVEGSIGNLSQAVCLSCSADLDRAEGVDWKFVDDNPSTCPSESPVVEEDDEEEGDGDEEEDDGDDENEEDDAEDDDDEDPVCISVDALAGYSREELVYESHRRAGVLCDQFGNCATPGHMVVYHERAMMMRTYCQQPGLSCVRRVKLVNSPRMKRALRVPSKSANLKFLAFAARMQSRSEEVILSQLVRFGW